METGNVGVGFGFGVADMTGSGGRVATGGTNALVADGAGVCFGAAVGVGVAGAAVIERDVDVAGCGRGDSVRTGAGVAPGLLTVVDEPAGTETSVPPALVSTVPEIVTTLVSPFGDTVTYESDPARMTDAIPALRTSYRLPKATALVTAYQTRPRVCCIRTT